jgi:hypothetical protein
MLIASGLNVSGSSPLAADEASHLPSCDQWLTTP